MELRKVIGSLRAVRYFEAERPVERAKIQVVLQAARMASRAVNVPWAKGLVLYRDQITEEERDALKTDWASVEFDLAPAYILWYHDMGARKTAIEGSRYPAVASGALQDVGAIGPGHGWSHKYVEEVILPEVLSPGLEAGPQRGGNADAALAMEQAYLAAVDEGLGACLVPFDEEAAQRLFGVPDTWEAIAAMPLGYSVESPEAGGQPPRPPWESMFFDGSLENPFRQDAAVTEELTRTGLIQQPAPIDWRHREVRALSRGYRLPLE